jgi:chitinase
MHRRALVVLAFLVLIPSACSSSGDPGSGGGGGGDDSGAGGGGAFSDASVPPSALAEIVPEAVFDELFLHRGTDPCRGAFYTYDAFLAAAATFPDFASVGDDATRRREVAAFFAQTAHETTGGWDAAPDGRYAWGLCWITEGGTVDPSVLADYCSPSETWPCAPGEKYFGRGPMQLSYNYNYGQCGDALGVDLLADPDQVATDPVLAFRAALWFWMTPQAPKPSCHDVMTGAHVPSPEDEAAGREPGFGLVTDIINGGLECGHGDDDRVQDRIGFYDRFVSLLGTDRGEDVDCGAMTPYGG